jgi:uncharacterized protein YegP (UPF0339 family)
LQEVSSELAQLKAQNGDLLAQLEVYRQKLETAQAASALAVLATHASAIQTITTAVDSTEQQQQQPVITTSSSTSSAMSSRKRTQYVLFAKL